MTSAFISYWRRHSPFVDFVEELLTSWGVKVFVDRQGLNSGSVSEQLGNWILESEYFLLVATHQSVERYWVQGEYDFAYINEKREKMIPLMLQRCSLKKIFTLASLEQVDFTSWPRGPKVYDATSKLARLMNIQLTSLECSTTTDVALAATVRRSSGSSPIRPRTAFSQTGDSLGNVQKDTKRSPRSSVRSTSYDRLANQLLFKTGETVPSAGLYTWAMYYDGTRSPVPNRVERQIRLERGEIFPPIRSTGKAAWWKRTGWYPRTQVIPQPEYPGGIPSKPGEFLERGPRGGEIRNPRVVTVERGDKLPPTQKSGRTWERIGPIKP